MKTTKITSGFVRDWVIRQIKDFNRATGLRIEPLDRVKERALLCDDPYDGSIMNYSHNRGTTIENSRFVLNINDNGTTSILNKGKGYVGFSKCNKNDSYNYWFGIAVAWARYKNEELPEFYVRIKDLKVGDKFKCNDDIYELLAVNLYTKRTAKYYCVLVATNSNIGWSVGDVLCFEGSRKVILSNI